MVLKNIPWGKRTIKPALSDKLFDLAIYFLLGLALAAVLYPLYFMSIASISEPNALYQGRVIFLPKDITYLGYQRIFSNTVIFRSYINSITYTLAGVLVSLVLTIPTAFALSRPELPGRAVILKLMIFTMYFYGGMVPLYIVVRGFRLLNTMWALILPTAIVTYNLIVARSFYISMIPGELFEASVLDGCNYTKFFFYIVLPLSKAIIAVMVLFYATKMWNGFMDALIYLNSENKFPLQLVLRNILLQSQALTLLDDSTAVAEQQKATELIKYGVVVVASLPMLCLYPFIQKHFVSGVMIGAVKG
ncbi:MAG: carbohydrate ABC transporter permease [Treponema sp.]|jgi:putative aldouronate transport system permease protein|nr:carbohydrate ABC transporter permease [Treponema sp.]